MVNICKHCWRTCDEIEDDLVRVSEDGEEGFFDYDEVDDNDLSLVSSCCSAGTVRVDEEDLEEMALDIDENCFTFDEALEKHGDLAYFVAENLVFIPGYDEF